MATLLDVTGEALQKLWIFALVNGSESGDRNPSARIDDRAIGDFACQVVSRHCASIGRRFDVRLTHQTHSQSHPDLFTTVGLYQINKLKSNFFKGQVSINIVYKRQ